jgi:multicomponent Na+:H+ antiporter subunit F
MSVLLTVSFAGLAFAGALSLARVLRPGSLVDRVLGLDFFVLVVATGVVVGAVARQADAFIPIVVVVSLLAFVATATVARYIEQRGAR